MQKKHSNKFQVLFPKSIFQSTPSKQGSEEYSETQLQSPELLNFHSDLNTLYTQIEETTSKCTQQMIEELTSKQTKDFFDMSQIISNKNSDFYNNKKRDSETFSQELKNLQKNIEKVTVLQRDASLNFSKSISKLAQTLKSLKKPSGQRTPSMMQCFKDIASPVQKRKIDFSSKLVKKLKK